MFIKNKIKDLFTGSRNENQVLAHARGRIPVCIKDLCSVCATEFWGQISLFMPGLNDVSKNKKILVKCIKLNSYDGNNSVPFSFFYLSQRVVLQ